MGSGNNVGELNVALIAQADQWSPILAKAKNDLREVADAAKKTGESTASSFKSIGTALANLVDQSGTLGRVIGAVGSGLPIAGAIGATAGIYEAIKATSDMRGERQAQIDAIAGIQLPDITGERQTPAQQHLNEINARFNAEADPYRERERVSRGRLEELRDQYARLPDHMDPVAQSTERNIGDQERELGFTRERLASIESRRKGDAGVYESKVDRERAARIDDNSTRQANINRSLSAQGTGSLGELDASHANAESSIIAAYRKVRAEAAAARTGGKGDEAKELDDIVVGLAEQLRLEDALYERLKHRLQATRELYEIQVNQAALSQTSAGFIGNVDFSSTDAIGAASGDYLWAFARAASGEP